MIGHRTEQVRQGQKIERMKRDQTFVVIQPKQTIVETPQDLTLERHGKIELGCMTGKTQTG